MPVIEKSIDKDGLMVERLDDGSTIRKCVDETCIQKHYGDSDMSHHDCNCTECNTTKRLEKSDTEAGPGESAHRVDIDALESALPAELFAAVKEHLTDPKKGEDESDDSGVGSAPEDAEEVGKALMSDLYDGIETETDESTQAILNKSEGNSKFSTPSAYAESMVKSDEIDPKEFDLEKDDNMTDALSKFYREDEA